MSTEGSRISSERGQTRRLPSVFVGRVLGERWKIIRELGVGGTASVFEAVHRNGRHVAIKVLHAELATDRVARKRFQSEGYAANRVAHPNAVAVLDDGIEPDGTAYLVMELLDGYSLSKRLADGTALPLIVVAMVASSVLDVLAKAHDQGVVHRDVKPGNIFITRDGQIKLLDFGVAHVSERLGISVITQAGSTVGTPEFMAPEQAAGRAHEVDALTDIWAVGATMFQLLTRRLVHEAPTASAALIKAASQPAPAVRSLAPALPLDLALVIDRALAFRRADRWPNARAMRKALLQACPELEGKGIAESLGAVTEPEASRRLRRPHLGGAPVSEPPPRSGPVSVRRSYRRAAIALSVCAVLGLALLGAGLFAAWHWLSTARTQPAPSASALQASAPSVSPEPPPRAAAPPAPVSAPLPVLSAAAHVAPARPVPSAQPVPSAAPSLSAPTRADDALDERK